MSVNLGRRVRSALAALALLSFAPARPLEGQAPAPVADAFADTDLEFRSIYSDARAVVRERLGPVVIVEMDQLILIHRGKRTEATVIPTAYHRLKSVAHVPLAVYVALAPHGNAPFDEARLDKLRAFRTRVAALGNAIEGAGFDEKAAARSRTILDRCGRFLDKVSASGGYAEGDLRAMTRELGPLVLAHAAEAAKAQVDAYHARMSGWRAMLTSEEWGRLRVVVMGVQMPRKHNVAVQYFAKLLGLPGESRRLVYAEELTGEAQALNLLATHQLDGELSLAFFDDPERMEIDLLGNAASVYLDTLDLSR